MYMNYCYKEQMLKFCELVKCNINYWKTNNRSSFTILMTTDKLTSEDQNDNLYTTSTLQFMVIVDYPLMNFIIIDDFNLIK